MTWFGNCKIWQIEMEVLTMSHTRLVGTILPSNHVVLVRVYSIAIQD